jgi:hypothetical protein
LRRRGGDAVDVDTPEAVADNDDRVITYWVAMCPVTPACMWRGRGHVTEEFALAAARAHGETDIPAHRHSNWPQFGFFGAGIDFLPPVDVPQWMHDDPEGL